MNILVVGNGFDLACGFPTRYTDFLDFIRVFDWLYAHEERENKNIWYSKGDIFSKLSKGVREKRIDISEMNWTWQYFCVVLGDACQLRSSQPQYGSTIDIVKEFYECLHPERKEIPEKTSWKLGKQNLWIEYFQYLRRNSENSFNGTNWVDFEEGIKNVITHLEKSIITGERSNKKKDASGEKGRIIGCLMEENNLVMPDTDQRLLRRFLQNDFEYLMAAFQIYVEYFIGERLRKYIDDERSKKIKENHGQDFLNVLKGKKINKILSFNYVDYYSKIFDLDADKDISFVHGVSGYLDYCAHRRYRDFRSFVGKGNIVLGYDLPQEDDEGVDWLFYRKYFQREVIGTSNTYMEWIENIENENQPNWEENKIYVFGHSLGVNDDDVLRRIFNLPKDNKATIEIYFLDSHSKRQLLINIQHFLKKEESIKMIRDKGNKGKIKFIPVSSLYSC